MAKEKTHDLVLVAEGTGELLALTTWLVMGTAILGQQFDKFSVEVVLYAVLSFTVVRVLPVFVALTGTASEPIASCSSHGSVREAWPASCLASSYWIRTSNIATSWR
jgi:NhaP-type Na+/H+ or K+/H+ antiporter